MTKRLRTRLRITYQGVNISRDIAPDLLSFAYTDNEGGKADDIAITLRNDHGKWADAWMPSQGDKISATIEQEGTKARFNLPCGTFTVDEITAGWSPATVTISGASVPSETDVARRQRSKAWESVRLSEIVQDVADAGGLSVLYMIDPDPLYDRRDQRDETDLAFLQRICTDEGFSLKCTDNQVVVFDPRTREITAPVAYYRRGEDDILSARFTAQSHSAFEQCLIEYVDPQTGKMVQYMHAPDGDTGGRTLKIVKRAENVAEAIRLAEAALYNANRGEIECALTVVGDTRISAGLTVGLEGFGRFSGKYYVETATHTVASGYVTSLTLKSASGETTERRLDGLENIIGG